MSKFYEVGSWKVKNFFKTKILKFSGKQCDTQSSLLYFSQNKCYFE